MMILPTMRAPKFDSGTTKSDEPMYYKSWGSLEWTIWGSLVFMCILGLVYLSSNCFRGKNDR